MKEVQHKELKRIVLLLDYFGCDYKIITDDGKEFGALKVASPTKKKYERKFPYGEITKWIRPQLDLNMPV